MIVKSITLPEDYARELQNLANEETDGNISAFIRMLLRKELLNHGIVPCMTCGRLMSIDESEEESCGEYMCVECCGGKAALEELRQAALGGGYIMYHDRSDGHIVPVRNTEIDFSPYRFPTKEHVVEAIEAIGSDRLKKHYFKVK